MNRDRYIWVKEKDKSACSDVILGKWGPCDCICQNHKIDLQLTSKQFVLLLVLYYKHVVNFKKVKKCHWFIKKKINDRQSLK